MRAHILVQQRCVEILEGFGRVGLGRAAEVCAFGGIDTSETNGDLFCLGLGTVVSRLCYYYLVVGGSRERGGGKEGIVPSSLSTPS